MPTDTSPSVTEAETQGMGVPPPGSGHSAEPEPVPVSALRASVPNALEFRPDHDGEFDEIVARFADGMVHVETMSDKSCYVGFYWDDGRYCQWWISSKKKLAYSHEDGISEPPRFTAQGVDRKPWLPDFMAIAHAQGIEAGTGETREAGLDAKHESAVAESDAPNSSIPVDETELVERMAALEPVLARLDYTLSSAPHEAEKAFVSLDDHRTILAALSIVRPHLTLDSKGGGRR